MTITKATIITPAQYQNATYAIDRNDNIWILWEENGLWLGNDRNEWRNTQEMVGHDNCEVNEISVINEQAQQEDVEALTCPIRLCESKLDLDALAKGIIEWI
jgi:hypothetical protein